MKRVLPWLRERTGGERPAPTVPGPSLAYVFGWVLVMLLGVQAITGAALAAFYAPSTTDAWASVAFLQDQMAAGWFVRGLHVHGASALVIIAGIHLLQTALFGAYKRPRELVWWIGIGLLVLVLGFAVTGYVLRWDQAGYWANRVEIGIAAGSPVIGGLLRKLAIGGNEYGNLTLTRFYALHVVVLPGLFAALAVLHVVLARQHGATPRPDRPGTRVALRWPEQSIRNAIAMAVVFAILLAYTAGTHGVGLMAPADPAAPYDARPLWYFRWLFVLRELVGPLDKLVALAAPALVAGFLVALPLVDRTVAPRSPRRPGPWVGAVAGMMLVIGALTVLSLTRDRGDEGYQRRQLEAAQLASRARAIAAKLGVPVTGPQDLFKTAPMYRARVLFAQQCAGCHDARSEDRKGPIIAPGHHSRAWVRGFLEAPSAPSYWGLTKLAKTEDAMKPVELAPAELDDLVEIVYAQTGASDVVADKAARGKELFDKTCTDCHSLDEGVAGGSGPGLAGIGSRDWFTGFVGNPKSTVHMGPDHSEMPRFDKDLTIVERDLLAEYLVWLRTATPRDLEQLDPIP